MSANNSSLRNLIIPSLLAILGTIIGGLVTGYLNVKLAREKYQSDLILKALESNNGPERLETLKMMVHTNLIQESSIREGVDKYIIEKQKDPESIPQVTSLVTPKLDQPIIGNARIYLLSGKKTDKSDLDSLQKTLLSAQFRVLDSKNNFNDPGRPASCEIRYFNSTDSSQAQKLSEFLQFKYSTPFPAKYYSDASAKSGYIEIWMGK